MPPPLRYTPRYTPLLPLLLLLACGCCVAPPPPPPGGAKASPPGLPRPSAAQLRLFQYGYGANGTQLQPPSLGAGLLGGLTMFMHYGLCTYLTTGFGTASTCQWDIQSDPVKYPDGVAPATAFTPPDDFSTDDWMRTARDLGASQVCLTVRHVDGFALWPTSANNYSVASSPWRGGKGDVVADFVASARTFGISPCFYIILGFDVYSNHTGVDPGTYLRQQETALTELLTRYGPIDRLWWDNYEIGCCQPVTHEGFFCRGGGTQARNASESGCPNWDTLVALVRRLSPATAVVPGPDGCLVNGETPGGTYPLYNVGPATGGSYACQAGKPPRFGGAARGSTDQSDGGGGGRRGTAAGAAASAVGAQSREQLAAPAVPAAASTFVVSESDFSFVTGNWFWNPGIPFMDADALWEQFTLKYGQGASLILNVPPNSSGVVPDEYRAVLRSFGRRRNATYAYPVAQLAAPVTARCADLSFTVDVPTGATFDQVVTVEDLSQGQAIAGYAVEVLDAGGAGRRRQQQQRWRRLGGSGFHGATVGARVVDWGLGHLSNVTALRWNCTALLPGAAQATVASFAAYLGAPGGR